MSFLPIADRELRLAARRRSTYLMRSLLALAVLVLWFSLLAAGSHSMRAAERGHLLFVALSVAALAFSLLAGLFLTSDCLSEERREGTLGLLFLTELKGYDVVLGKLAATSLHALYGLLAILPLLALPLLLGGVTAGEFWRMTLVLLLTLLWSLSIGMAVSARSQDARQAMGGTLLILVFLTGVLPLLWWLAGATIKARGCDFLLWPSPVYLFSCSFDVYYRSRYGWEFERSLVIVVLFSVGSLVFASLRLPRVWREKGEESGPGPASGGQRPRWRFGSPEFCAGRRRWLKTSPFYWLASRDRLPQRVAGWNLAVLYPVWLCFVAGALGGSMRNKNLCFTVAVFMGYGMHQVVKGLMAFEASRRLSEDRRSGALELLRVTPLSVGLILEGQWQAFEEIFRGPLRLMLLANLILFWLVVVENPLGMQADALVIFAEIFVGGAVLLWLDAFALCWVGMWMAFRSPRQNRAILGTAARVILPPWLGFLFFVFLGIGGVGWSTGDIAGLAAIYLIGGVVLDLAWVARTKLVLRDQLRAGQAEQDAVGIDRIGEKTVEC